MPKVASLIILLAEKDSLFLRTKIPITPRQHCCLLLFIIMNTNLKKITPYFVALLIFVAISIIYCLPYYQGKILQQSDDVSAKCMMQETAEHIKVSDEPVWWTGAMFSGMPTFQTTGTPLETSPVRIFIQRVSYLWLNVGNGGGLILGYLIGFFILLCAFGVNRWLAIVGAIAIAMSSYFLIIIEAGHITKAMTLGYLAPVLAGFYLIFRGKAKFGLPLVLIYGCLGYIPHPQMTYYVFLAIGILALVELHMHIKQKELKKYFISIAIFSAAVLVGMGTRYTQFAYNAEYVKETMRGGHSELVNDEKEPANQHRGLSIDYATQWSYGIAESFTFMIPNFMGASSNYNVGEDSGVYDEMVENGVPKASARSFVQGLPMYWGKQPFTSGPVYMGAIVCFLFVLALFLVKGAYKWGLLIATLFSVFLSWGHNFMWLTELFFYYFPFYSKFRAVSSILIVAEITMPLLGFLGLKVITDKEVKREEILRAVKFSALITGGICALFALLGGTIFNFSSPNDAQMFTQLPTWLSQAIVDERVSMLRSDSWRSFIFIALATALLWFYVEEKLRCKYFILGLGVLVMLDMIPVNLRFFNHDNYVQKKNYNKNFAIQPYEQAILQDKDPHFRVFNLAANTFNDARTSYRLKSIGGYHAAKLRRYQDLIDAHISKNNMAVINMLNTKYIIMPGENGQPTPHPNPGAMGNAWFVDNLKLVNTANEESDALNYMNLRTSAVADRKFAKQATLLNTEPDSLAHVKLTKYEPQRMQYISKSSVDKMAVFSEIYYPKGWTAYIDGKPVEHFRVNYTLRALNIPAGEHKIEFVFLPDVIVNGERVAWACYILMFLIIGGCIVAHFIEKRKVIKNISE